MWVTYRELLAPHTHEKRDAPRRGPLISIQSRYTTRGSAEFVPMPKGNCVICVLMEARDVFIFAGFYK
jgi:hypothetical protein